MQNCRVSTNLGIRRSHRIIFRTDHHLSQPWPLSKSLLLNLIRNGQIFRALYITNYMKWISLIIVYVSWWCKYTLKTHRQNDICIVEDNNETLIVIWLNLWIYNFTYICLIINSHLYTNSGFIYWCYSVYHTYMVHRIKVLKTQN